MMISYSNERKTLMALGVVVTAISFYATYTGLSEFLAGSSSTSASTSHSALSVALVGVLTLLMALCLGTALSHERGMFLRVVSSLSYVLLTLWSVGFGYGYWWSTIAGSEKTETSFAAMAESSHRIIAKYKVRMSLLKVNADALSELSSAQLDRETRVGGTCGTQSPPGKGPLYSARLAVDNSAQSIVSAIRLQWVTALRSEIELLSSTLEASQATLLSGSSSLRTRKEAFHALSDRLRLAHSSILGIEGTYLDQVSRQAKTLFKNLLVPPGSPGFICYDTQLSGSIKVMVESLEAATHEIKLPDVSLMSFLEGPEGTAHAIKKLWLPIIGAVRSPSSVWTGDAEKISLSGREVIALLAAVMIEIMLLVIAVALSRAGTKRNFDLINELQSYTAHMKAKRESLEGVTNSLREEFSHLLDQAMFDNPLPWLKAHIFDHDGVLYLAAPNIHNAVNVAAGTLESKRVQALQSLLTRLVTGNFIVTVTMEEMEKALEYEATYDRTNIRAASDLWEVRDSAIPRVDVPTEERGRMMVLDVNGQPYPWMEGSSLRQRNFGLISKAIGALSVAGWSNSLTSSLVLYKVVWEKTGLFGKGPVVYPLLRVID